MKTYVLLVSKKFPIKHPKAGDETLFNEKIKLGFKKHTIRLNYYLWLKRIKEIHNGKAVLSVREWSGKPYQTNQVELFRTTQVGIQKLEKVENVFMVDGLDIDLCFHELAANDGLSYQDFKDWFSPIKPNQPYAIIHFTNFRY